LELELLAKTATELEQLLESLRRKPFQGNDDSLGWIISSGRVREGPVNSLERKSMADTLPAVTKLFTEPYMVLFLLHNTLGACMHRKAARGSGFALETAKDEELRVQLR